MSINWTDYDAFDWQASSQTPMNETERADIEDIARRVVEIPDSLAEQNWGTASPPGRFAATVIRVRADIPHRFANEAAHCGFDELGVKIFKDNSDAKREFERVFPCHNRLIHQLPGLPNQQVQKTLAAIWDTDRTSRRRGIVIQQWIDGVTLDVLLRRQAAQAAQSPATVQNLLHQMMCEIVIPLWSAGLIWWDIRDANWCYNPVEHRLYLIDVDSLCAYDDEILNQPTVWDRRDKGRETALSRLRQTVWRILEPHVKRNRGKVQTHLKTLWDTEIAGPFRALGHNTESSKAARDAFERYLSRAMEVAAWSPTSRQKRDSK